jgi:hypothetical protein
MKVYEMRKNVIKITDKSFDKNSRARVIDAISLALFLLFLAWLASMMVVASLSVSHALHHGMLLVGISSLVLSLLLEIYAGSDNAQLHKLDPDRFQIEAMVAPESQ